MRIKPKCVLLVGNYCGVGSVKLIRKISITAVCLLLHVIAFCQQDSAAQKNISILGVASFYSKHLEGALTATGEIFHHSQLVAASNSFKLNSWVRITNLRNGLSVIVRINNRMGKAMQTLGRVADVTIAAAQQLGFINRGLARVKVEEVAIGTAR